MIINASFLHNYIVSSTCLIYNIYIYIYHRLGIGVCHQPDVKLGGFQSQLGASCIYSFTEKWWYNETVCVWQYTYIYIYIYIYI